MKKILIKLLCILLVISMVSCGEVVGPDPDTNIGPDTNNGGTDQGGSEEEQPEEKPASFTVSLSYNGQPFIPEEKLEARWFDGYSYRTAPFGEDGVASVEGLDGDYSVSLSALPEGYTYDPNRYSASNSSPNVVVELYALSKPQSNSGSGKNYYTQSINLNKTGYYRATIKKAGDVVYFRFIPPKSGTYSFRSLLDEKANNVNAILHYFPSSSAVFLGDPVLITGGAEGFTTNFYFELNIDDSNIAQGNGGRVERAFAIEVDITDGEYPVYLDFELSYVDDYDRVDTKSDIIVPEELDKINPSEHEYSDADYEFKHAFMNIGGQNIFEDDFYRYNEQSGFYHLYDEEKYASTGGFGPILYAHITSNPVFLDKSLTTIESAGNKALTVSNGTENYKLFIEGFYPLTVDPGANNPQATVGPYLCDRYCPCRTSNSCQGGCPLECTKCLDTCRKVPSAGIGCVGYAGKVNSDGLCPVTKELKEFLQKFAVSQRYFIDGEGWVEIQSDPPYHAGEDDQWLFACGYYVPKE